MADPFFGEIRPFAFTYAPYDWAMCQGQTIYVNQNQPLFAVIGTAFGGDGVTSFKLPDMQGRIPAHRDSRDSAFTVGQNKGVGQVTLTQDQSVAHSHTLQAANVNGTQQLPGNGTTPPAASLLSVVFGGTTGTSAIKTKPAYADPGTATAMSNNAVAPYGGSGGSVLAHDNNQPSLVLNFCISLAGEWPERP